MPGVNQPISVIKRNPAGQELWRYSGTLLRRDFHTLVLEANFNAPDRPFMGIELLTGDRFIETYFTDRWYNVFEIHDREDDRLKGWYCNVGQPIIIESDHEISYVDLALDLWVTPDGAQTVLDELEFAALNLDDDTKSKARAALDELQQIFSNKR
jgi:predicted RNA-binding protein associated with RNAse of E/G family